MSHEFSLEEAKRALALNKQFDDAMDRGLYLPAMGIRAKIRGLQPITPYELGLKPANELPESDSRRYDHVFHIRNPRLAWERQHAFEQYVEQQLRAGVVIPDSDYAALVARRQNTQDPSHKSAEQIEVAVDKIASCQWFPLCVYRVGSATVSLSGGTNMREGGEYPLAVYLPDGEVAYGQASQKRVEALQAAKYSVYPINEVGQRDAYHTGPLYPAPGTS